MPLNQKVLEVQPTGRGEVVGWSAFNRGEFKPAGGLARCFALTTALTDAVTAMWKVCTHLAPDCQRFVRKPNGFFNTYFCVEFRSSNFAVTAERRLVRGGFPLNPLAAEAGRNYNILFTITADDEQLLNHIVQSFKHESPGIDILRES